MTRKPDQPKPPKRQPSIGHERRANSLYKRSQSTGKRAKLAKVQAKETQGRQSE